MAESILERYIAQRSPALRNQLVEANLGIAAAVARKFVGRGVEYDDLYQVASFALLKAIERYDPDRGVKLTSFVVPSMVGEIKNYFRDRSRAIRLPRKGSEGLARVEEARAKLHARLLREPTYAELAAEAGLAMDALIEILEMRSAALPASMDEAREDDVPLGERLRAHRIARCGAQPARHAAGNGAAHHRAALFRGKEPARSGGPTERFTNDGFPRGTPRAWQYARNSFARIAINAWRMGT